MFELQHSVASCEDVRGLLSLRALIAGETVSIVAGEVVIYSRRDLRRYAAVVPVVPTSPS
jgi:hypothetical protein